MTKPHECNFSFGIDGKCFVCGKASPQKRSEPPLLCAKCHRPGLVPWGPPFCQPCEKAYQAFLYKRRHRFDPNHRRLTEQRSPSLAR